jgi:hypothetical protein
LHWSSSFPKTTWCETERITLGPWWHCADLEKEEKQYSQSKAILLSFNLIFIQFCGSHTGISGLF